MHPKKANPAPMKYAIMKGMTILFLINPWIIKKKVGPKRLANPIPTKTSPYISEDNLIP